MLPKRVLVLGGASSGKSAYAENLCVSSGLTRAYIATAQIWDDEMKTKVDRHKDMRGNDWTTFEAHSSLEILRDMDPDCVVLLDCLTMWLNNQMMADRDIWAAWDSDADHIAACPARLVMVSNDVGQGIVPDNALARQFRDAQGKLNQRVAAQSDLVVNVIAGLPQILKGQLP
ncbi:bifunctional adenosylcobinamide kinase/adenosylcobinamide-phosphate guanylyltransferase [Nereida sp. MMG025]|uniref:bifunctional adenosylcobinamide kinase/adenosylcobinamide-phosphate guanylyltransferase n=1 Tax=Nereida sp. MMG025 TaxID=2909981 RepID=UPI001EFF773A|nr:bifunctional adenosylcobinamide kinase/adenosylcobinamide-phosphate guanylyltransferase [Nereida sp. MMG025]MCF6445545.1 bifunctional adenosylcobinamide kinase/adenosylcobinamide-phosphate guanylyltransferase [Nereida sp. MMG025]